MRMRAMRLVERALKNFYILHDSAGKRGLLKIAPASQPRARTYKMGGPINYTEMVGEDAVSPSAEAYLTRVTPKRAGN